MKLFLVSRYDELYPDRNDLSVVVAETPESAVEMVKEEYDKKPYWSYYGYYEVAVAEITLDDPKIVLKSFQEIKRKNTRLYFVSRNDGCDIDQYNAAVVAAGSPEEAVDLLKEAHGVFNDNLWGNYDVTVDEIIPIEPEIILESWNEE